MAHTDLNEYFIRGTISIEFRVGADSKIFILPTTGFTTPPGIKSSAIAFSISISTQPILLQLTNNDNKYVELTSKDANIFDALLNIVGHQKIVELRLENAGVAPIVVGFIYPVI